MSTHNELRHGELEDVHYRLEVEDLTLPQLQAALLNLTERLQRLSEPTRRPCREIRCCRRSAGACERRIRTVPSR